MLKKSFASAIAFLALAAVANASVTSVEWISTDGDPAVAGSVKNDLVTTMTADWTNAVISVDLTQGSLINPSTGIGQEFAFGSPADDSWLDAPNNPSSFISIIGADYVNGQFDWFDTFAGSGVVDGLAARLFASDDAQGTWSVEMYDVEGTGLTQLSGAVVDGFFGEGGGDVPEPGAMAILFGMATAGLAIRRRKRG